MILGQNFKFLLSLCMVIMDVEMMFSKMAVFLSSVPLVFLSKSPFKLNIEIKVS